MDFTEKIFERIDLQQIRSFLLEGAMSHIIETESYK